MSASALPSGSSKKALRYRARARLFFGRWSSSARPGASQVRALAAEAELESATEGPQSRRTITRRWAAWREAVSVWLTNLHSANEARLLLERRYLDGRSAVFSDLGRDRAHCARPPSDPPG